MHFGFSTGAFEKGHRMLKKGHFQPKKEHYLVKKGTLSQKNFKIRNQTFEKSVGKFFRTLHKE